MTDPDSENQTEPAQRRTSQKRATQKQTPFAQLPAEQAQRKAATQTSPQRPQEPPAWRSLAGLRAVQNAAEPPSRPVLLFNFIPFLHIAVCLASSMMMIGGTGKLLLFLALLYLLPPLAVRLALAFFGRPQGMLPQRSRGFLVWWWATQWQTAFNRLPWLEELLRLVPGLYPLWIRLWGGRISLQTYVAPGVQIVDRWAVQVQAGAVLGLRCVLSGHLGTRDTAGRSIVIVAAPCVQAHAIVGGFAMLGPGAVLRAGQVLPAGRHLGPYAQWPRGEQPTSEQPTSEQPASDQPASDQPMSPPQDTP